MIFPRIGVAVAELQGQYQTKLVQGISKQARNLGYDVLVYNCFVKGYAPSDYEKGEQYFLDLIQFNLLDGLIVVGDTIKWKGLIDKFIKNLDKHCKCPVVFIDYSIGHSYEDISVDDVYPFEHIVDHLILEHNCKDILFYSGPLSVSTTVTRLEGYRRSLKKHHMSELEDICLEANYWKQSGNDIARKIVTGERQRPDALICCGDDMAIGAVEEFQSQGWKIPEDIIVIGYDGTDNAVRCNPSITSYDPPIEAAGENAVLTLHAKITGEPVETYSNDPGRLLLGGTCGCPEDRTYTKRIYYKNAADNAFVNFLDSNMMEDMTEAKDFITVLGCIQYYLYLVNDWNDFYLCLNSDWMESDEKAHALSKKPFTDEMTMYIRSDNRHNRTVQEHFKFKKFMPPLYEEHDYPKTYFINPIHQGIKCFGFTAITFRTNAVFDLGYVNWCRHLSNAIEYLRMNQTLAKMAVTDSLTGLYTRMGIEHNIGFINIRIHDPGVKMFVFEVDADGLKTTNDSFGHHCGDLLLMEIGKAIQKSVRSTEIAARTGGDEFVIFGCDEYEDTVIEDRIAEIQGYLDQVNASGELDFTISASMGGVVKRIDSEAEIDAMVKQADENMYRMKVLHHKNRPN